MSIAVKNIDVLPMVNNDNLDETFFEAEEKEVMFKEDGSLEDKIGTLKHSMFWIETSMIRIENNLKLQTRIIQKLQGDMEELQWNCLILVCKKITELLKILFSWMCCCGTEIPAEHPIIRA